MDGSFVDKLIRRARTMLPAETAMLVECRADGGDRACQRLLEHIVCCGLEGKELCDEPFEAVVFEDRVLLRCSGCRKGRDYPVIIGVGRGQTREEAEQNALYALTVPVGSQTRRWGEGPEEARVESCILNRVAYARL